MNTSLTRRTVSTLRTTIVLLAFATLAAVGFATVRDLAPPTTAHTDAAAHMPAATPHRDGYHAPAGAPMPAHVFGR